MLSKKKLRVTQARGVSSLFLTMQLYSTWQYINFPQIKSLPMTATGNPALYVNYKHLSILFSLQDPSEEEEWERGRETAAREGQSATSSMK